MERFPVRFQGHFGLGFVMEASPEEIEEAVKNLEKKNRTKVRISEEEKERLRGDIERRMEIRRRKEQLRRRRYYK